jgi:hypothetical protein
VEIKFISKLEVIFRPTAADTIIILTSNEPSGTLPAFPDFHPEMEKSAIQTHPTHAPGARITVVLINSSNYFDLTYQLP